MFGSIDKVTIQGVVDCDKKSLETDENLRGRLRYVAADGNYLTRKIESARGAELDELAQSFGLKRR